MPSWPSRRWTRPSWLPRELLYTAVTRGQARGDRRRHRGDDPSRRVASRGPRLGLHDRSGRGREPGMPRSAPSPGGRRRPCTDLVGSPGFQPSSTSSSSSNRWGRHRAHGASGSANSPIRSWWSSNRVAVTRSKILMSQSVSPQPYSELAAGVRLVVAPSIEKISVRTPRTSAF